MGSKRTIKTGRIDSLGREIKVSGNTNDHPTHDHVTINELRDDFNSTCEVGKTYSSDLFDPELLEHHVKNGDVIKQSSGDGYSIYNYSQSTVYERKWDEVTLQTRGLILDDETGEVMARPFAKFFNHNQVEVADIPLDAEVEITDKMDGSLIIPFRDRDGNMRTCTKGSFHSDQAQYMHNVLLDNNIEEMPEHITPLFEGIYPENRIVLDYGDTIDAFLLGGVNKKTGKVISVNDKVFDFYEGGKTHTFDGTSLEDAFRMKPRDNAEGVIVRDINTDNMMKIKQDDYIAIHRIVTNITVQKVNKALAEGTFDHMLDTIPDEFYDVVHKYADQNKALYDEVIKELDMNKDFVYSHVDNPEDRKEIAVFINKNETIPNNIKGKLMNYMFNGANNPKFQRSIYRDIKKHL